MREGRTLLLMVAAPLIVLFVMGLIFSSNPSQSGRSAIGICDLDQTNASHLFTSSIQNASDIIDYGFQPDCPAVLEKNVTDGRISAGLIIPLGFEAGITSGDTQNITFMLDNSRFEVSPTLEAFVKAAVQETDQQIGEQFIRSVWQKLDSANARLGGLLSNLNDTRNRAMGMKMRLAQTADSLESLNISSVRSEIELANATVGQTRGQLAIASSNLTTIQSHFDDYQQTLGQTESDLVQIDDSLDNVSAYITGMYSGVNCTDLIYGAYCQSLSVLNAQVNASQQSVEARLGKVRSAQIDLASANQTIQDFKANIAVAQNGTYMAEDKITNMLGFVNQLQQNRDSALQTIGDVDNSLDEMVNSTYDLEKTVNSSRGEIAEVTSRAPSSIISPMIISTSYLFGTRPFFDFMLPSLLPLILMFIALFLASTSLVREKHNGTLARVYSSQVNRFEFAAIKVLSYTIVLLPEAVLLALFAAVFYNAFPIADWTVWIPVIVTLALLIFVFVAAGVLIAIYSQSEATAFLASLVIGLPLLFLSGLLFPFEFMPPLVSFAGTATPLSQAVIGMQSVLIYHSSQTASSLALIGYGVLLTLLAGLSIKK